MRRLRSTPRRAALLAALFSTVCGGSEAPNNPDPSPTPSAPTSGGAVAGPYLLRVTPAAACGMGGAASFPMTAVAAGTAPYPGVQVLVAGSDVLELEFRSAGDAMTGGLGTTEQGALASEALRVWVRTIATGAVTRAADGRGEIVTGRMAGYLALGHASGPEGSLGSCNSTDHTFSLRTR